jgi:sortase A
MQYASKRSLLIAFAAGTVGVACIAEAAWIHAKAWLAQHLIASAWERARRGEANVRPWPWADTRPVARLTVWSQKTHALLVLDGSNGRNLAFGPAHDSASVLPGAPGNSVIGGHRDTHFRFLKDLRLGDRLRAELADGRSSEFVVVNSGVVDSEAMSIALDSAMPRLTLVTCYPFDAIQPGGPLRFVVTADWIADAGNTPPR